jgi:hypothetical protein
MNKNKVEGIYKEVDVQSRNLPEENHENSQPG